MHRALTNPDILSKIFKILLPYWADDECVSRDLYSCAQVNKSFFSEAIRVLWEVCGHNAPGVSHLAGITQQNPARGQIYANHIMHLYFGFSEDGGKEGNYGPITFDATYLDILPSLSFPQLQSVVIYGTGEEIKDHELECYLQPKLESFVLDGEFAGHLETFLDTVTRRCPSIKTIDFGCKGSLTLRTGKFMAKNPQLNSFSLPSARSAWSQVDFEPICRMTELQQLCVPFIEASWLDGMDGGWPELDELRTTLSTETIGRMLQVAPELGIVELKLRSSPSPSDAFVKLSQFIQLRSLDVKMVDTDVQRGPCIDFQDLINLARNFPQLFKFHVADDRSHPAIYGISDSLFDDLTENLPEVSDFCLDVGDTSALTFNAVCSLGTHCQKLWQAKLSCNIDWMQDLESEIPSGVQFTFSELELVMRGERSTLESWTDADRDRLSRFAEAFAKLAPELSSIELPGGSDADEYVKKILDESIDEREAENYR